MAPRVSSVDILYGSTGVTKTSRLGDAVEYYHAKTGKRARLIITDPGGIDPIQPLVDSGLIETFRVVSQRPALIQDFDKLTAGWWPLDPSNPLSPLGPPNLKDIAVLLFDGISSMCELFVEKHTTGIKLAHDEKNNIVMVPGQVSVSDMPKNTVIYSGVGDDLSTYYARRPMSKADYGEIQRAVRTGLGNLAMLPVPCICTALECKAEATDDEGNTKPVRGPLFIGKALTGTCGNLFGNMIHMDFLPLQVSVDNPVNPKGEKLTVYQPSPILFLKNHLDPKDPLRIPYPAKVRAPRSLYDKVPPMAPPDLKALYEFLDALREEERRMRSKVSLGVAPEVSVATTTNKEK